MAADPDIELSDRIVKTIRQLNMGLYVNPASVADLLGDCNVALSRLKGEALKAYRTLYNFDNPVLTEEERRALDELASGNDDEG